MDCCLYKACSVEVYNNSIYESVKNQQGHTSLHCRKVVDQLSNMVPQEQCESVYITRKCSTSYVKVSLGGQCVRF